MSVTRGPHRSALMLAMACSPVAAQSPDDRAEPDSDASVEVAESGGVILGTVPRTTEDYRIDGVLDDAIWRDALMIELDTETNPGENVPAPVMTTAYLIENGSHLLIAFDAKDPNPDAIRAYLRDRDSAFDDDFVGVVIDTFNDERYGYEFFANALGVQMDMTQDDVVRNEDSSWDAIWDSQGTITETGYSVEMAVPFSQLRFPSGGGEQTWGIDVLRFYPRNDRVRMSNNPQDRGRNCYLCQLDKVQGFADVEPGRGLEITPSVVASRAEQYDSALGGLVAGDTESDVGLNVLWSVTENMTANVALNPDFSQVEADVPQLEINNQFTLSYPEARPFFLEGADFFSTPFNAVFTRTVADPDVGAKLTGRAGTSTFGVFAAEDAITNLLFPGAFGSSVTSLDRSNRAVAARYSYGLGTSSSIGALVTSRSGDDYANDVAGIDGLFRVNDTHNIRFQYLNTRTKYPDNVVADFGQPAERFGGNARRINYNYNTRLWFANANYEDIDEGFRADLGFITRVDSEQRNVGFGRVWHGDGRSWWNQFRVGMNTGDRHDGSGLQIARFTEVYTNVQGPLQSYFNLGMNENRQYWNGAYYDSRNTFVYGQIRPAAGLRINMQISQGNQIDYVNSRLGDQFNFSPSIDWNINRHLLLRLQHTRRTLETQAGESIFEADLTDFRLTWQFNVRSFLRLTAQRQQVERNSAVYVAPVEDSTHSLASQLLYSYKVNPRTVLFAGYSENELANAQFLDPTTTDRALFLKVSYAWMP